LRGALRRIVYPAHNVVIVALLAYAAQVGGERPALLLAALAHRVTSHAAAGFERFLALLGVAGLLLRRLGIQAGLPQKGRDRANLVIVQTEGWHFGAFAPLVRVLQPNRNPFLVQLGAHFL